jgi:hypothetical protein
MVKLFVEGTGDHQADQKTECREAFKRLFEKAGIQNKPRVVPCGARKAAYDDFCVALKNKEDCLLLIDSEESVESFGAPWRHLKNRDGDKWECPQGAADDLCHLMVQCMESWFIADVDTLASYFGKGFDARKLPSAPNDKIELVSKEKLLKGLDKATGKNYSKGRHSFRILGSLDPKKIKDASPWAKRFFDALKSFMDNPTG